MKAQMTLEGLRLISTRKTQKLTHTSKWERERAHAGCAEGRRLAGAVPSSPAAVSRHARSLLAAGHPGCGLAALAVPAGG
eukprot:1157250-Pelagomonas_calceolata.AAC.2